jgi:uncharacterized protein (TIGR02246 family)
LVAALEDAWNRGDAAAFAAAFTPDAYFVHILGHHGAGRDAIRAGHNAIFTTIYRGSTTRIEVEDVRFPMPDVALLRLKNHLDYGDGGLPRRVVSRPSVVLTRRDGAWQIELMHNTLIFNESQPEAVERLLGSHPHRDG